MEIRDKIEIIKENMLSSQKGFGYIGALIAVILISVGAIGWVVLTHNDVLFHPLGSFPSPSLPPISSSMVGEGLRSAILISTDKNTYHQGEKIIITTENHIPEIWLYSNTIEKQGDIPTEIDKINCPCNAFCRVAAYTKMPLGRQESTWNQKARKCEQQGDVFTESTKQVSAGIYNSPYAKHAII